MSNNETANGKKNTLNLGDLFRFNFPASLSEMLALGKCS